MLSGLFFLYGIFLFLCSFLLAIGLVQKPKIKKEEGYVRLSYAASMEKLVEAMNRLEKYVQNEKA